MLLIIRVGDGWDCSWASSCQAFDAIGTIAAWEWATAAAGAFASRACSASDRPKLDRFGPIAAAVWQLAPGSGDFSLLDHRRAGRYDEVLR